jgi:hypothetical protein
MAHTMCRDPFARGEYGRVCHGPGERAWCGQTTIASSSLARALSPVTTIRMSR